MHIFHVVLPEDWEYYKARPSYQAESLRTEGFIHCSYKHQLDEVLKRYYDGVKKVIILTIETDKLIPKLVEEPSTGGKVYPHIYGRLNHNAVVKAEERKL